jgi:hypothetical protein
MQIGSKKNIDLLDLAGCSVCIDCRTAKNHIKVHFLAKINLEN